MKLSEFSKAHSHFFIYNLISTCQNLVVKIIDDGLHFSFSLYFSFFVSFHFSFISYFQINSGQRLSVMLSHQSQVDGKVTSVIVRECGQTLGLGLVDKNRTVVNYQSTTDIGLGDRHMIWKSYNIVQSGLEGLRVQKDREEFRWSQGQEMTSRDMSSSWCTHSVHIYSGD